MNLRVTLDREADAAYICLTTAGRHGRTVEAVPDEIFLDLDDTGRLQGVEILHASHVLPREVIQAAEEIG